MPQECQTEVGLVDVSLDAEPSPDPPLTFIDVRALTVDAQVMSDAVPTTAIHAGVRVGERDIDLRRSLNLRPLVDHGPAWIPDARQMGVHDTLVHIESLVSA